MKRNAIGLLLGAGLLSLGVFAAIPFTKTNELEVSATQHSANYNAYTYSGTYYNGISASATEGMEGTLRSTLTTLIHPTSVPVYGSSGSDHLSTVLQYADQDPTNSSNMVYLYTRDSVTKNAASTWNREHVWPKSLSNSCWDESRAGSDLLHLRPTYKDTNTQRGSLKYGEISSASALTYSGMTYGYKNSTYFMPLDSVKGDVARICMYVWTAYYNEYGSSLPSLTNVFQSFDVLMNWHVSDKPDVMEGNRNNYSQNSSMQGNRNPFVDHPEYAWKIFGSQCSESVLNAAKAAYPDGSTPSNYVSISSSSASLVIGNTTSLSATSSNNSNITWTTSNASIASLNTNQTSSGGSVTVTGVAAGSATITAKATISGNEYSATCNVTVSASGGGTYTLVTSNSSLSNGDSVIVKTSDDLGVTGWNNNKDATVSDEEGNWKKYTVSDASNSGWKLSDDTVSKYIASPSANEFKYSTSGGICSADSEGHLICNERYLCVNGTNYRFYGSIGSFTPFFIYKVTGSTPTPTTYTITYNANGGTGTMSSTTGVSPQVAACTFTAPAGKEFSKWNDASDGTGTNYSVGQTVSQDVTLYAIWETPPADYSKYFTKITSTSDISNGKYVIVYNNLIFDGSLNSFDVTGNIKELNLANLLTSYFTISSGNIKGASGKYIGRSSDSNGLETSTSALSNTISFDESGNLVVVSAGGAYLRYNSASDQQRFRYFKSTTYTSQKAIQLYKVNFAKTVLDEITCNAAGTSQPTGSWSALENYYNTLSTTEKNSIKTTSASESGTDIQKAMAKYDYIVGKYGTATYKDFIGRNPSPINGSRIGIFDNLNIAENNTILVVVIASVLSTATLAGYFCLRRRKEK